MMLFLSNRNLENLKSVFQSQKIDDTVAQSVTVQQLEHLGLVMGDAIAFMKEFQGEGSSSSSSTRPKKYTERLGELKEKIRTKHNQTDDGSRFYNVTVSLKTKEKDGRFVRKAKQSINLHVDGNCLFLTILSMARTKFRVSPTVSCYLADSKGEVLSKASKRLSSYVKATKTAKKAPHVYLHYVNSYGHFRWHGELTGEIPISDTNEGNEEAQVEEENQEQEQDLSPDEEVRIVLLFQGAGSRENFQLRLLGGVGLFVSQLGRNSIFHLKHLDHAFFYKKVVPDRPKNVLTAMRRG